MLRLGYGGGHFRNGASEMEEQKHNEDAHEDARAEQWQTIARALNAYPAGWSEAIYETICWALSNGIGGDHADVRDLVDEAVDRAMMDA